MELSNKPLSREHFLRQYGATVTLSTLWFWLEGCPKPKGTTNTAASPFAPLKPGESISGFYEIPEHLTPWESSASLQEIANAFKGIADKIIAKAEKQLARTELPAEDRIAFLLTVASMHAYKGQPEKAYGVLQQARAFVEPDPKLAHEWLYTLIFFLGVTAMRQGENENCVLCIGEGACILPIAPGAVHTKKDGSTRAIKHFTEYLAEFPEDLETRWLLNLAHMTLGEHPAKVDPRYLISLDHYYKPELTLGKFKEIGAQVGVNRLNLGGGGIMDDFDNDGFLDIVATSWDATHPMVYYRNKGDGTFEDRTNAAGLSGQLGGLYCVQGDYNNDGHLDFFICRGAWFRMPMRPSLLRNNGDGTFTDVTEAAGLAFPVNSISASWADYNNDGLLDLFICCEAQQNRLYRNNGNGTFTEVAVDAGVAGIDGMYKGAAWIDFDNDGWPDLYVNNLSGTPTLYRNNHDGTFTDVTMEMGIDGPKGGFACWAFDYNNDGFLDIFATSYDHSVAEIVKGIIGQPHTLNGNRLWRNDGGKKFVDVTKEAGLDMVFATMGSNFGDFDNDGFLDIYLGTGDPNYTSLVPNRLFKNDDGKRFVEVTGDSGTGHLQKGHGTACGDWDNDGNVDIFIEMGGAVPGDQFRNCLFQNPGHDNHWLTVKLIGKKTNRSAIGARIKVVTAGPTPLTVHRHVSSGSSFGASPLQQTIGVGKATKIATLEITWPTSKTTQVFTDIAVDQFIEITEFEKAYKPTPRKRIVVKG